MGERAVSRAVLDRLLWPERIAIVGASSNPDAIGGRPLRLLRQLDYPGRVYPVNPRHQTLGDVQAFPSIGSVPEPVDMAIVAVPAASVPAVLRECAAAGVGTAVVFSSGFADGGETALEAELAAAAGDGVRFLGPNSEGFCNVVGRVPAGFSPTIDPERGLRELRGGEVAIIAQSGGLGFALFHDGQRRGLGFSYVISTGNETDLGALDFLEYALEDERTRVVLLFVEGFRQASRFPELARRATELGKPLIVAKVGRSTAGQRAAASHTAHLVGRDAAYDAVFRRWGVARARDQEHAVDLALAFARAPLPAGPRVAIVTASGGSGVWAADACEDEGLEVPVLSERLQARLRELMPTYGAAANPVDVTAQIIQTAGGFGPVLELLFASGEVDAIVLVTTLLNPERLADEEDTLRRLLDDSGKPLVVYSYTQPSEESVEVLSRLGLAWFSTGHRAARALRALWDRSRALRRAGSAAGATAVAARGPAVEDAGLLLEFEAKQLLREWGLRTPAGRVARSASEAAAAAAELGGPVALKLQSPAVLHKSDGGGVVLGLSGAEAVSEAAGAMLAGAPAGAPTVLLVEEMAEPGVEMLLGAVDDPDFGPLVTAGMGGVDVEVVPDVVTAPAPVSVAEARELLSELRGYPRLRAHRGRPAADVDAAAEALARLSELAVASAGAFREIDVNPLIVHAAGRGATVVDALLTGGGPP